MCLKGHGLSIRWPHPLSRVHKSPRSSIPTDTVAITSMAQKKNTRACLHPWVPRSFYDTKMRFVGTPINPCCQFINKLSSPQPVSSNLTLSQLHGQSRGGSSSGPKSRYRSATIQSKRPTACHHTNCIFKCPLVSSICPPRHDIAFYTKRRNRGHAAAVSRREQGWLSGRATLKAGWLEHLHDMHSGYVGLKQSQS